MIDDKKIMNNLDNVSSMEEVTRTLVDNYKKYQSHNMTESDAVIQLSFCRNIAHTIALRWVRMHNMKSMRHISKEGVK